jgi:hypothetical protein
MAYLTFSISTSVKLKVDINKVMCIGSQCLFSWLRKEFIVRVWQLKGSRLQKGQFLNVSADQSNRHDYSDGSPREGHTNNQISTFGVSVQYTAGQNYLDMRVIASTLAC